MPATDTAQIDGEPAPLLRVRGVSKSFPGVRALVGVDLTLRLGEVHALTGENGSGKSTLAKIIGGEHHPDAGIIEWNGSAVTIGSPAAALRRGIVTISQEPTLAPTLTVAENIFLGRLPRGRWGAIDWKKLNEGAAAALGELGVDVDPEQVVGDLNAEFRQEIEIARALSARGRLLILDEATSSLSEAAGERLLTIVEAQRQAGVAVLMITHRMGELYRSCTAATVLRDGQLVATVPLPETKEPELVRLMVGRDLGDYYGARSRAKSAAAAVLTVRGLRTPDGALTPTSFDVRAGEILGVAGLVGSGKAELGLALTGAIRSSGDVRVRGRQVTLRSPRTALAGGIALVPDDRRQLAILPGRSVADNFGVAWLDTHKRLGVIRSRHVRRQVAMGIRDYGVVTASDATHIDKLSGGNQQKVVLGRTFMRGCDVYVLNEPTRGIDVGAKSAIYALLQELAARGAAIVLISSELPELLGMSDRVLVFFQGAPRAEFDAAGLDEATVAAVAVSGRQLENPSNEARSSGR